MTQYRMFLAAVLAAFVLTACSGGKDDMKTEDKAAEAPTEQAAEPSAEQTDSATTEDANKAETATQGTAQESDTTTETQQTTN